jgi:hypothetical protein
LSAHEKTIKHKNFEMSFENKPVIDNLISFREYIDQNKIINSKNRDKLNEEYWNIEKKKKIICECGEIISRAWLPQHKEQSNIKLIWLHRIEK